MTPAGRAEQRRIRECLFQYVDAIWDHPKAYARAENLGDHPNMRNNSLADDPGYPLAYDPAFSAVAGMCDLAVALCGNAHAASAAAGDDLDD